ncbi:prenyltransferase [Nocardioides sp. MAHUQ-72]|uniref:prenyltransferase n=1 Tax=unclassified Nocardioides TaxID=2615069 RepID=UPI00361D9A89
MRADLPAWVPGLEGVLNAAEVAETAASIAAMQEPDGAVPWTVGEHTDVWNHVESAMALLVGGQVEASDRAFEWCLATQREDGSWPMKLVGGAVEDHSGETNMSAYLAVGVWHSWLVRGDVGLVRRYWPAVRRGLDWVVSMQLPFGGIAWSREWTDGRPAKVNEEALLAGSSSIYQSLRAGVALAELLGDPQPDWELAGGRLGHALREHRDLFLDKSEYSMDWYYPVLGGAVRGEAGRALLASRWDEFVEPGLGIRCVLPDPWVTGAETCELAMALDAVGDRERALQLLVDMQHLRAEQGRYWTGYVFPDKVNWPVEHTTYTAAAVVLAVDALADGTGGAGIMRGTTLAADFREVGLECGCAPGDRSGDRVAGLAGRPS